MSLPQVVRRYASALFEVAQEKGLVSEVENDMQTLAGIFRELPEVLEWCREDRVHVGSEESFVAAAFLPYVGSLTAATLKLAARHRRMPLLLLLPAAIRILADRASSRLPVLLEAAQEPDAELVAAVAEFMTEKTGRQAQVSSRILPKLVGGVRILWEDRVIDLSAKEKLRQLRTLLTSP